MKRQDAVQGVFKIIFCVDVLKLFLTRTSVQMKSYAPSREGGAAMVAGLRSGHFPFLVLPKGLHGAHGLENSRGPGQSLLGVRLT